jgi:hypothetical protein
MMTKMPKRIFAIVAAPAAIPPKPKIAAMIEITRKTNAQYSNIVRSLHELAARDENGCL